MVKNTWLKKQKPQNLKLPHAVWSEVERCAQHLEVELGRINIRPAVIPPAAADVLF